VTGKPRNKNEIPKGIDLGPSGFGDGDSSFSPEFNVRPDPASVPPGGEDGRGDVSDGVPERWEITIAMLAHLLGAVGLLVGVVGGMVGPVVIWLIYRKDSPYIEHHAREATNFQLTIVAILAGCFLLTGLTCGLLLPKMLIPVIMQLAFGIIATIAAKSGKWYRYPICLRMLKKEGTDQVSSMR
jgi:uncharacterized protein